MQVTCADKSTDEKVATLDARQDAHLRAGPRGPRRSQRAARGASPSPPTRRRRSAASLVIFIAVGTPPAEPTGAPICASSRAVAREIGRETSRATSRRWSRRARCPVGTSHEGARLDPGGAATARRCEGRTSVRRLESGVPPRGRRHRRLHAARPRGDRHRRRLAGHGDPQGPLPASLPQRDALRDHQPRRRPSWSKYAANAFLATKISFINEVANLCEQVGATCRRVARAMGLDRRIGLEVPARRPGLRGLLLPEGHALGGALRPRASDRASRSSRR